MTGRSIDGSYHDVILVVVIACSVSVRISGTLYVLRGQYRRTYPLLSA